MAVRGWFARKLLHALPVIGPAERAMAARDWPEAIARWRSILSDYPRMAPVRVHLQLSAAHRSAGEFSNAEEVLRVAQSRFPGAVAVAIELAKLAMDRKEWVEAATRLQSILAIYGEDASPHVHIQLAKTHRRRGALDEAADAVRRGKARYPHRPELAVQEVLVLASSGHTGEGVDKLSRLLSESLTDGASGLPAAINEIVEAIDLIASKDGASAERVRALLREVLYGSSTAASPAAPNPSSRVKLAYVSSFPMPSPAANCVHVLKMCSALRRNGVDVTLFAEGGLDNSPIAREALFRDFDVSDPFDYVRVEPGPRYTDTNFRKALAAAAASSTHLITRSPKAAYFAALQGIATLLELHAPPSSSPFVRDLSRLPAFRGLIVITGALHKEIGRRIPELADKMCVIPDAADPPRADVRVFELVKNASAVLHVGYVGHLYPGKGLELIVELAVRRPTFTFHILGGDPGDVRRWEQRGSRPRNIVFYGHRPHAEVPAFLRAVDVAIAPYQRRVLARGNKLDIAQWMSPLKLFEYMANAKPIVSSDLPALREVLANGRNAILVDPDDVDRWVATLDLLRANPELRETLGREAKRDFDEKFTWTKRAERVFGQLLAKKETDGLIPLADRREQLPGKTQAQRREARHRNRFTRTGSSPSICWLYENKLSGWAYGINSQRIASRLKDFNHFFGAEHTSQGAEFDLKLCFDIHVHARHLGKVSSLSVVRIGGPKPLMQIGGGDPELLKKAFADVAAIIALSPELEAVAAEFHPNVFLIPNGIDLELWCPKVLSQRDPHRPFRAGMAAALKTASQRAVKGLEIATAACEHAGIELVAVGRGANQIPHDRMIADFYSQIDVLVHPVGPGKEGSSNVIMECLALGIPVITTVHAGYHAGKLRHRHDVLFSEREHEALARALMELKKDAELRVRLSAASRAFAMAHHNLDLIGRQYANVFRFVLGMDETSPRMSNVSIHETD